MEKEIEEYLLRMTHMLNGQLRGAINAKARETNFQLITFTVNDIFISAYNLGKLVINQEEALEQLKGDLGITQENLDKLNEQDNP